MNVNLSEKELKLVDVAMVLLQDTGLYNVEEIAVLRKKMVGRIV